MVLSKGEITITEIFDGEVGQSAVIAVLDNDSHVIPTDTEGTPGAGAFDGASTTLSIFEGTTDVTADGWDITVQKSTGVDGTWDVKSFTFTAHTLTEDNGSVRFSCAKAGFPTIYKTFTLTKSKQGTVGENAVQAFLAKDNSYFKRDVLNETITPASVEFQSLQKEGAGGETPLAAYFVVYEQVVEAYKVNDYLELVVQDELEGDKEYIVSDKEFPYVERYRSTGPETTLDYTVGSNSVGLKVEVYRDPEFTQLIDREQLPVLIDGMTTYQHVRFADDEYGAGFDTNPEGKKYMGTMNSHYATGSNDPTDYAWALFKGDDSYVFFKYSNDGGSTFTANNGETPGDYMGVYKTDINEASPNVGDYVWYKTKGEKGQDGISVDKVNVKYYRSNSQTTLEGGNWLDNPPAWKDGTYIWSKTVTTYTNQSPTETDPVCITGGKGVDGKGIVDIEEQYARHTSKDSAPAGSAFGPTRPTWEPGTYIWTRTVITYTDNEVVPTTPVVDASWEAIDNIKVGGRNLILSSEVLPATYLSDNGDVTSGGSGAWFTTGYIPVKSGDLFTISMLIEKDGYSRVAYYDKEKNFIKRDLFRNQEVTQIIPEQDGYIRWSPDANGGEYKQGYKLEKGNKATDWTPAPEDVDGNIKSVKDSVDNLENTTLPALEDGLLNKSEKEAVRQALKVVESDKKGVDAQHTSLYNNSSLSGAPKSSLRTAKLDYNTAYDNLNSSIQTVLNVADGTRITQTQINNVENKFSAYGSALATIRQRFEEALDAISGKKIDAIEVGGRNLLRDSEERILRPKNTGTAADNFHYETLWYASDEGQKYTISAKVEITDGDFSDISVYSNFGGSSPSTVNVPITNGRIERTYTASDTTDTARVLLYAGRTSDTRGNGVIFREIKIEKGNKATDWTPAPEDVEHQQNLKTYIPVRYIRDWSAGSTANTGNHKYEIQAYANGDNVALGKPVSANGSTNSGLSYLTDGNTSGTYANAGNSSTPVYMEIDLGQVYYNVDSIGVWRYHNDNRTYHQTKTEVSADGSTWYPIFDSFVEGEYPETPAGKTFANTWAKYEATQVSSAGLTIANEAIGLRVQKNGVIAAINASVNGDESNAKISADRVDIEGKVTFSSLDSAAQSKINAIETTAGGAVTAANEAHSRAESAEANAITHADTISRVQELDGGAKKFMNVAGYHQSSANVPGYMVIKTPLTYSYMTRMKITGYNYQESKTNIDITVGFYAYTSNTFHQYSYISQGDFEYDKVQLARDSSGRAVVIIGQPGTTYRYPKISVDEVIAGQSTPPDSFKDGFSIDITTDISMYEVIVPSVPGGDILTDIKSADTKATDAKGKTDAWTATGKTTINGGMIETDSIKAGAIDVVDLLAQNIVATKIQSTDLTANRIKGGTLSAINGPTTLNLNDGTFNIGNKLKYNGSTLALNVDELQIKGSSGATQSDVSTAIDNIEVGGRNLIVEKSLMVGYLESNGNINSNSGWRMTDFISVEGSTNYIASGYRNLGNGPSTCFYDSSKNFISGIRNNNSNGTPENDQRRLVKTPSNAQYMRFSFEVGDIGKVKLEKGNKATDWSPAPEDVDESINNVASELAGVESRVSTAEQKITDNAIVSTVTSSTTFSNVASLAESAKSTLDSKESVWDGKASPTDISNAVDGIEVGGRNLIPNSNDFSNHTGYSGAKVSFESGVSVTDWDANDATKITVEGGTGSSSIKTTPRIETGLYSTEFTYSYWVKNVGDVPMEFNYNGFNGSPVSLIQPNESKRVIVTGRTRSDYTWFQHQIRPTSGYEDKDIEIILWRSQLEKGNKATDWTPAPEDVEDSINNVASDLSSVESRVSTAEQKITDKAIVSTVTSSTTFTTVKNNADSAKSTLDSRSSVWDSKATPSDIDSKILSDKKIPDRRDTNELPSWYRSKYPQQIVTEFKGRSALGIGSATYGTLTTKVSWSNNSGDNISQQYENNGEIFYRTGNSSDTAWGNWKTTEDTSSSSQKANTAETNAKKHADTKVGEVASELATVESRVRTAEQKITDNAIVSTVSSSTKFKDVESKANSAKSTLDSKASEWDGKATEYKVNYSFTSSPDYVILLCRSDVSGTRNHAIGTLIGRRNSGYYSSGKVDIVFNNNTSGTTPTGYIEATDMQYTNSWSMVTCDYGGANYIALRHNTGNTYGLWDTGSTFTGQISSSGEMLLPVQIADVSNVKDFDTSKVSSPTTRLDQRLKSAELKITDSAIVSTVRKSTTYKNDLSGKVSTNEIISRINQTAESISIDASKINLNGAVTISSFENGLKSDFNATKSKADTSDSKLKSDELKPVYNNEYKSTNIPSGSGNRWYRIALNVGNRAHGRFLIRDTTSSQHSTAVFEAGINYGKDPYINLNSYGLYSSPSFTKARIVYKSTYDHVYLELYIRENSRTQNLAYWLTENIQESGWSGQNWTTGDVPTGYQTLEVEINSGSTTSSVASDAKSKTDKWSYSNTTEIDGGTIRTGTIEAETIKGRLPGNKLSLDGNVEITSSLRVPVANITGLTANNITTGTLKDANNRNNINLNNGTFSLANGDIVYNGSTLSITGGVTFSALDSVTQANITNGATAKSTLDSKERVWDGKATPGDVSTAIDNVKIGGRNLVVRANELKNTQINTDGQLSGTSGNDAMRDNISVTPGEILTFTKVPNGDNWWRWRWMNSDGGYISRNADNRNNFQWTVPSNAYFIQVSYPNNSLPKIERGNKATDWTPAPEDVDAGISAAQSTANTALSNAGTANDAISDIMSDLKITPVEKAELSRLWERIKAEYTQLSSQASVLDVASATRTNYTNAYNSLNGNVPRIETDILASMTTNYTLTTTTRHNFKNKMNRYFTEAETISKAITDKIQANANSAQSTANTANSKANTIEGKINNAVTTIDGTGVTVKDGSFFLEDSTSNEKYSIVSKGNLVKDHSFELLGFDRGTEDAQGNFEIDWNPDPWYGWQTHGTPKIFSARDNGLFLTSGMFGMNTALVNVSNYLSQLVITQPFQDKHYTVSAFFKLPSNATANTTAYIQVISRNSDGVLHKTSFKHATLSTADYEWAGYPTEKSYKMQRIVHTFNVDDLIDGLENYHKTDASIEIALRTTNSNWAYVDGVQVVPGIHATHYSPETSLYNMMNGVNGEKANNIRTDALRAVFIHMERSGLGSWSLTPSTNHTSASTAHALRFNYDSAGTVLSVGSNGFISTNGDFTVGGDRVVSSGSNSNGEWVKFYDGTMICYRQTSETFNINNSTNGGQARRTDLFVWAYPAEFTSSPVVSVNTHIATGYPIYSYINGSAGHYVNYRVALPAPIDLSLNGYVHHIAIGRWK